jgi:hypothetical protein
VGATLFHRCLASRMFISLAVVGSELSHGFASHMGWWPAVGSMLRRRRSSREKRLKMCEQVSSDSYQKGKSYKG